VLTRSQFQEVASTSADSDSQHFTKEMLTTEMQVCVFKEPTLDSEEPYAIQFPGDFHAASEAQRAGQSATQLAAANVTGLRVIGERDGN
jgi:hypothetical protein